MDSFSVFKVSASALAAQRERMNVIASNMANAHSTRTEEGGPYTRKEIVFASELIDESKGGLAGVTVAGIENDEAAPYNRVYQPGHPDADGEGFVTMPNINTLEEMVNMMTALRAYEASVSTFNTGKAMFLKALEIGRV